MKKDIPLAILQVIEPFLNGLDQAKLDIDRSGESIFRVTDAEQGSTFFFEIATATLNSSGTNNVVIRYKPTSNVDVKVHEYTYTASQIHPLFNSWLKLIEGYQKVKSIYDDPILKQYADDFYTEFESADEDATTASFNLKQQLRLDSALSQVIDVLKEQETEANKEAIMEIIEEVVEVQSTVTENTKQETLSKLSKIFAKIQKVGIKVIKHVVPIIEKEIIGAVIKSGVTVAGAAAAAHLLNP